MIEIKQHFDVTSIIVMVVTLILFIAALLTKGFTHDLLLEAAVFLISIKLIIMAYKNIDATAELHEKLDRLSTQLESIDKKITHKN